MVPSMNSEETMQPGLPLKSTSGTNLKSCYRGKGCIKNESSTAAPGVWSGSQGYNRAPSLVLLLCAGYVRSPGILPAPAHLKEKDSSLVSCFQE